MVDPLYGETPVSLMFHCETGVSYFTAKLVFRYTLSRNWCFAILYCDHLKYTPKYQFR